MRIPVTLADRLRSRRGSVQTCLIATAAQRAWGGSWSVNHQRAELNTDDGRVMTWRPSAGAHLVMSLFDAGLPVPVRAVRLVRGNGAPGMVRPASGRKASQPARTAPEAAGTTASGMRAGRARKAAAGAAAAGALLLVVSGLAWVVVAVIGAAAAVLAAVIVRNLRAHHRAPRAPHLRAEPDQGRAAWRGSHTPAATPPAAQQGSFTRPEPPQPETNPVQCPAPKAAPAGGEPALEVADLEPAPIGG